MERTEEVIRAEMVAAQEAYHQLMQLDAVPKAKAAEVSDAVKRLRVELSAFLAKGAKPCADCKSPLTGHLKKLVAANEAKQTAEARTYEIICPDCERRSQGPTPRAAVILWNAGEFV